MRLFGFRCDGPGCGEEHQVKPIQQPWTAPPFDTLPAGWLVVQEKQDDKDNSFKEPLTFCSVNCLACWSTEKSTEKMELT